MIRPSWCLHDPPRVMERGTKRNQPWVPTMVYKMILWNLLVSACMHVGECDVREIRKAIKAALTFTIFSISLSNLRYICILMLLTIWYCQSSMKVDACTWTWLWLAETILATTLKVLDVSFIIFVYELLWLDV